MTRVTPQQLSSISFPDNAKYAPLRPLNPRFAASSDDKEKEKKAAGPQAIFGGGRKSDNKQEQRAVGGSIVMLRDLQPDVEAEYVELSKALWPDAPPAAAEQPAPEASTTAPGAVAGTSSSGELEGGEADAPPPFEYPFDDE
jgi:26S proteasome regulatory subunit N2